MIATSSKTLGPRADSGCGSTETANTRPWRSRADS